MKHKLFSRVLYISFFIGFILYFSFCVNNYQYKKQKVAHSKINYEYLDFRMQELSKLSLKDLRVLADSGDANAQLLLFKFVIMQDIKDDQELNAAISLLFQAADNGHPIAQYLVFCMLYDGINIEKNINRAVDYLKKSAASDFHIALLQLGIMYYTGEEDIEIKKDYSIARDYAMKAFNAGNKEATFFLFILALKKQDLFDKDASQKYFQLSLQQEFYLPLLIQSLNYALNNDNERAKEYYNKAILVLNEPKNKFGDVLLINFINIDDNAPYIPTLDAILNYAANPEMPLSDPNFAKFIDLVLMCKSYNAW